ncbi:hypothetical protein Tco_1498817, partial [Tanacetum coccineum]
WFTAAAEPWRVVRVGDGVRCGGVDGGCGAAAAERGGSGDDVWRGCDGCGGSVVMAGGGQGHSVRGWCYDEGGGMVGCGGEAAGGGGGAWRRVDMGIG